MIRGLYTSALGMTTQMKRMDVVSNNIANSDTTGFKRDMVATRSFSEELMRRLDDPDTYSPLHATRVGGVSLGLFVDTVVTDFAMGGLQQTGGSFDLALSGDGFFAVSVTDAAGETTEKYTRDGSFSLASDGTLVTKEGNFVTGENGLIQIPPNTDTSINASGQIFSNGEFVDQIRTVAFENPDSLRKFGDNLYDATEESAPIAFSGTVTQGAVEKSNVNSVREMVEMITLSRGYEANQKVITMLEATLGQAVNEIARK